MTSSPEIRISCLTLLILGALTLLFPGAPEAETVLKADTVEVTPNKTVARGDVQFTHPDWSVNCDYLLIKKEDRIDRISAEENVRLSYGELSFKSDRLTGRLDKEDSSELLGLKLLQASGEFEGLGFRGEELGLETDDGEIKNLTLTGDVELSVEGDSSLRGDRVSLNRVNEGWDLEVSGNVESKTDSSAVRAERMSGQIEAGSENGGTQITRLTGDSVTGRLELEGGNGKGPELRFNAESASFEFRTSSTLNRAELSDSSFSSCKRCRVGGGCAYSITATNSSLIDREFVLAESARLNAFGLPIWWSPLYFFTAKDVGLPERPYFPRVGYSSNEGISLRGAVPVFIDRNNFGNLVVDYFSRGTGLGLGIDYYSGGADLTGLAEIYGTFRLREDNYLKLDTTFDSRLTDWLAFSTDINYQRGTFQGSSYDQNEWTLSLGAEEQNPGWKATATREEKEETNGNTDEEITHTIEKYPELSLNWEEPLELPAKIELNSSLGYYRENKTSWSQIRSGARGALGGKFSLARSLRSNFTLILDGKASLDQYYETEPGNFLTRAWGKVEPGVRIEGPGVMEVRFNHQARMGRSPFAFDRIERMDRLTFDFKSSRPGINQTLGFYYDFVPDDGFSDISYTVNLSRYSLDQTIALDYGVSAGFLKSISSKTTYAPGSFEVGISTGYDFSDESISETILNLGFAGEENQLGFKVVTEPPDRLLKEISTEMDLTAFDNWTFSLTGKYDFQKGEVSSLSYSIHHTLQDCLKLGLRGNKSGIWFDVELVGF
ncbi:hypothetical protein KGY71_05465 [Candidatus Bipolaricaulota bacterium]|nr:hypothetical protein [Candidatus Bipolaricaulota bacterium]